MQSFCRKMFVVSTIAAGAMSLGGCAADVINFPNVTDLTESVRHVLTPEEQKRTIEEMALEQSGHRDEAITAIENR